MTLRPVVAPVACRCGGRPAGATPVPGRLALLGAGSGQPGTQQSFSSSRLASVRVTSFPRATLALGGVTSKHVSLLLSWQKETSPPPLSAGRKAKLEKKSGYDFTDMGLRPWAAPQARGWHSGTRRCGSCHCPEPVQQVPPVQGMLWRPWDPRGTAWRRQCLR